MTVPDLSPDEQMVQLRPKEPMPLCITRLVVTILIVVPFIWAVIGLEISPERIYRAPAEVWVLLRGMFPPDFDDSGRIVAKLLESIYIAWIGTVMGAIFSFPLSFMAATNVAPRWMAIPTRGVLSAIRAFPELILAIILIVPFGLLWPRSVHRRIGDRSSLNRYARQVVVRGHRGGRRRTNRSYQRGRRNSC